MIESCAVRQLTHALQTCIAFQRLHTSARACAQVHAHARAHTHSCVYARGMQNNIGASHGNSGCGGHGNGGGCIAEFARMALSASLAPPFARRCQKRGASTARSDRPGSGLLRRGLSWRAASTIGYCTGHLLYKQALDSIFSCSVVPPHAGADLDIM